MCSSHYLLVKDFWVLSLVSCLQSLTMIKSLIFLALVVFGKATDYCSNSVCRNRSHIACGNNGAFGSACSSDRKLVDMTNDLKSAILHSHNSKRNTLASGSLSPFDPAVRMATMQWDSELEKLAELNVKRCTFSHDACHNTDKFKSSGQNLGAKWWSGGVKQSDKGIILDLIDAWWSEKKDTTKQQLQKYPSSSPRKTIGHFTVMTADRNIAVGCAAIYFRDKSMNNYYSVILACNYATTNMINFEMYKSGPTASKCTTGRNPNYKGLCSTSERYDVNKWY